MGKGYFSCVYLYMRWVLLQEAEAQDFQGFLPGFLHGAMHTLIPCHLLPQ